MCNHSFAFKNGVGTCILCGTTIPQNAPSELVTKPDFKQELTALLNRHSKENDSGTPDYILAEYLIGCLAMYEVTIEKRASWLGEAINGI